MGKYKFKDGITLKQLRDLAEKMPRMHDESFKVIRTVSKVELSNAGIQTVEGQPTKSRSTDITEDGFKPVNHFKQLKKAATKGGWKAVSEYCDEVRKIALTNIKEPENGPTQTEQEKKPD